MKRYCKKVDLNDVVFLRQAIKDCLRTRWRRKDTWRYFQKLLKQPYYVVRKISRDELIDYATVDVRRHIINRDVEFLTIKYHTKFDGTCGKEREIGIQDFELQMYDYVAVAGLSDILRRVGEYQCASIKGRGIHYGVDAVKKWLRGKDRVYAVKMDIKKCFPSISQDRLLSYLDKYIANDDLQWLIKRLFSEMKDGLSIGSYLSQHLCNLYLSQLYHELSENIYYTRRGKRINSVDHVLFYMDDILLLGNNKKELTKAAKHAVDYACESLGLVIKPDWKVFVPSDTVYIDMMGYRIYRHYTNIRRRTFLRIRRTFKRVKKYMSLKDARIIISYYGYFMYGKLFTVAKKLNVYNLIRKAKKDNKRSTEKEKL